MLRRYTLHSDSRFVASAALVTALVAFGQFAGCTTEDTDPEPATTAAGGASSTTTGSTTSASNTTGSSTAAASTTGAAGGAGESNATTGSSTTSPATGKCATKVTLASSTPGIADFDAYDGTADLDTWSFALGGDSATGVYSGPFSYGDETTGDPEEFGMVDGNESTYAYSISDTLAEEYGGGLGLWLSACVDASVFDGISFWVRGLAPTGEAKFTVLTGETTAVEPTAADGPVGSCDFPEAECIHPTYTFPVTDTWTEVRVPWAAMMPGSAGGTPITADGSNVWQIQFDVGVEWVPDDAGVYQPTPAPYEFAVDSLTFY